MYHAARPSTISPRIRIVSGVAVQEITFPDTRPAGIMRIRFSPDEISLAGARTLRHPRTLC